MDENGNVNPDPAAPSAQEPVASPQIVSINDSQQFQQTNQTPLETAPPINIDSPSDESRRNRQSNSGGMLSFGLTLVAAFVLVQVINMFFFQSYKVFGSSMFPTLHDGDRLIISKLGKTSSKLMRKDYQPKRGDVIVFIDPQRSDLQLIKRVIGLPGERVVVKDGKLTVYNAENPGGFNPDDADYGKDLPKSSGAADVTVPKNHIFVSGDNREGSNSLDSRNELGTVPEGLIIGTLKVRIFPFDDAKFF